MKQFQEFLGEAKTDVSDSGKINERSTMQTVSSDLKKIDKALDTVQKILLINRADITSVASYDVGVTRQIENQIKMMNDFLKTLKKAVK